MKIVKATESEHTYKLVDDAGKIIGGIRYQYDDGVVEVGRLMVHPDYRQQGLARKLLAFVDEQCSQDRRVLYTCTKSWINIKLYTKMGYKAVREIQDETGLSFVYMEKEDLSLCLSLCTGFQSGLRPWS
ncbi:MAG: GNAT family N-acetyltransferase [Veillonella sp.]|nr:GNAT family N-acetyltransferase [Veillonella sp.]